MAGLARVIAESRGEDPEEDLESCSPWSRGSPPEEALEALDRSTGRPALAPQPPPPVRPVSGPTGAGDWPLSFDQERLAHAPADDPELVSWNVDAASRIRGPLDVPALLAAFAAHRPPPRGLAHHVPGRGRPAGAAGRTAWSPRDVSRHRPDRPAAGDCASRPAARALFDADAGPVRPGERSAGARRAGPPRRGRDHLCLLTVHHLVTDWITFQICCAASWLTIYEAVRAAAPVCSPAAAGAVPGLRRSGSASGSGRGAADGRVSWRRERLEGFPLALELPTDRPRPAGAEPARRPAAGPAPAASARSGCAAWRGARGSTLFMAVLAVLGGPAPARLRPGE